MKPRSFAAALGAILFAAISCAPPAPPAPYQVLPPRTPATSTRPVLLYSMAFTAEGEKQYEPNGPYREVLARRLHGRADGRAPHQFDPRVGRQPANR